MDLIVSLPFVTVPPRGEIFATAQVQEYFKADFVGRTMRPGSPSRGPVLSRHIIG